MIASLLWKCVIRRMAVIKYGLLLGLIRRYHCYREQFSEWLDLVYNNKIIY